MALHEDDEESPAHLSLIAYAGRATADMLAIRSNDMPPIDRIDSIASERKDRDCDGGD